MYSSAMDDALFDDVDQHLLSGLNAAQREVAEHRGSPLLVLGRLAVFFQNRC
jgi:hypothetical protein